MQDVTGHIYIRAAGYMAPNILLGVTCRICTEEQQCSDSACTGGIILTPNGVAVTKIMTAFEKKSKL